MPQTSVDCATPDENLVWEMKCQRCFRIEIIFYLESKDLDFFFLDFWLKNLYTSSNLYIKIYLKVVKYNMWILEMLDLHLGFIIYWLLFTYSQTVAPWI